MVAPHICLRVSGNTNVSSIQKILSYLLKISSYSSPSIKQLLILHFVQHDTAVLNNSALFLPFWFDISGNALTSSFTLCVVEAIRNGIDILVGTPGRIKDHLQNNKLNLSKLKHVVLDEVDQMLDMGFAEQVEEILASSYEKGKCNMLCLAL